MKEKLISLREQYKTNPGWCWLLATIFLFPILPEYVSPFILFIGFIVKACIFKNGMISK